MALHEELLQRPFSLNTNRILRTLNILCAKSRGRVGQGFIRLSTSLAKITEFSAMDTLILTMFSIKLINTLPIPAVKESDYPTEVHVVDETISVLREAFAMKLATHLRVTEWKCTDVSQKKPSATATSPWLRTSCRKRPVAYMQFSIKMQFRSTKARSH